MTAQMRPPARRLPPVAWPGDAADFATALRAAVRASPAAVERFAATLAGYLGAWDALPTASGRAALALLLRALKAGAAAGRGEVVMPAYTCPALAQVTLDAGLTPRLVDVQPETLGMIEPALEEVVGDRTLAIIHVHPFGLPLALTAARRAADRAAAILIEDAAQALGARLASPATGAAMRAGAAGDFGLLSFGPGKPLAAGGGGALVVCDPQHTAALVEAWRALPNAGFGGALAALIAAQAATTPAGWRIATRLGAVRWGDSDAGLRYRMARMAPPAAAIAMHRLARLDAVAARRRETAAALRDALATLEGLFLPAPEPGAAPVYPRFPVLLADAARRDAAHAALTEAGLGAGRMYGRTLAAQFPGLGGAFPGAEALAGRLLTLPTHAYVTPADIARIAETLQPFA